MASTFNNDQSYRKLPPIRVKETHANGKDQAHIENTSSFSRETHGLVRLPPIIRVDGSVASPEPNDTENHKEYLDNFASPRPLNKTINENSNGTDINRSKDWSRRRKSLKRQILQDKTKNFNEFIKDSHLDQDDIQKPSISHSEKDKDYGYARRGSKPVSLLTTTHSECRRRRGSLITSETEKPLHRGRRLAKSSPDLSSSRKQYGSPVRMPDKSRLDSQLFHADNDFFRVATNQSNPRRPSKMKFANKNLIHQKPSLKSRWEFPSEPQSSPCTPVIQLLDDEESVRDQQRNSLGDIYSSDERKPLIFPRKKLAGKEENAVDELIIEGKTCRQNKRLTSRVSSPRPRDSFLKIPQGQTKRDSLYDLEQILSLLNIESKSDARKKRSSSVYDLKEFLEMQSHSTSDSGQNTDDVTTITNKEPTNSEFLSSLGVENPDTRRGSTYDLLEFLSLNAKSGGNAEQLSNENVKGNTVPSHFLFPGPGEVIEPSDIRRSSAYDLMEFLSLSRQNDEVLINSDANHSQPLAPNTLESSSQGDDTRKESVYDLGEFLSLSRKRNGALSTVQDKAEPSVQSSPLLSPRLPSNSTLRIKRESIYDLQEFLGVLQKESDVKRQPSKSTNQQRKDTQDLNQIVDNETETLKPKDEQHKGRSLSIYDLREFLSLYSTQSGTGNQLQRKPSEISQSSIMINVTEDEHGNSSVDDVFLAVPVEAGAGRKRSSISSVAELNELLSIINDTTRKRSVSDAPASLTRHDSGGTKSLLDLGEFLSVLNSDDSPLRRRLSSVSDRGNRSPSSLSRNDSCGGSSLYDLEEFLAIINDSSGQVKSVEIDSQQEPDQGNEISIPVPQLPPRNDRKEQISHLGLLTEVNNKTNGNTADGQKASVEQCL